MTGLEGESVKLTGQFYDNEERIVEKMVEKDFIPTFFPEWSVKFVRIAC